MRNVVAVGDKTEVSRTSSKRRDDLKRTLLSGQIDATQACPTYPGFLAVTFHELESIMIPFGR